MKTFIWLLAVMAVGVTQAYAQGDPKGSDTADSPLEGGQRSVEPAEEQPAPESETAESDEAAPTTATAVTLESPREEVGKEQARPLLEDPLETKSVLWGRPVSYGGFLIEIGNTEQPLRLLNPLRSIPPELEEPQRPTDNLRYYPRSERVQGATLFSLKF